MGEDKYFKIGFFSSSDFTIKILEDILETEKKEQTLVNKAKEQFLNLKKNFSNFDNEKNIEETIQNYSDFFEKPIKLAFVVSQPDRILRKKTISNPVTKFARENNLTILTPENINSDEEFLINLKNKYEINLGITASYGQILSKKILDSAKTGFINWHPSLLPKYRGATPMQTALSNGDEKTGVSWIEMVKKMDAGNIFLQIEKEIDQTNDFKTLAEKLSTLGQQTWALASFLYLVSFSNNPSLLRRQPLIKGQGGDFFKTEDCGGFQPIEQIESEATFCKMLSKEDRLIYPKEMEAGEVFNHFRAYSVFPKTSFQSKYFEGEIKIVELGSFTSNSKKTENFSNQEHPPSHLEREEFEVFEGEFLVSKTKDKNGNKVFLKCKNETFLEVKKICLENGKNIDFRGFEFGK